MFDIKKHCWAKEIIKTLGFDFSLFPPAYPAATCNGVVSKEAACVTGLTAGTPVVIGTGDNAASALGSGLISQGQGMTTIGTSGVVLTHSDAPVIDMQGNVHTFCHAIEDAWTLTNSTLSAGLSLRWFADTFCQEERMLAEQKGMSIYAYLDERAEKIPIGAEQLLFLPYLIGERPPLHSPEDRGVFFGLSLHHTKEHLLRAVLEGVAYSLKICLAQFPLLDISFSQIILCGGGSKSTLWRQMFSGIMHLPLSVPASTDTAVLGAAILGGVGAKVYSDIKTGVLKATSWQASYAPIEENYWAYEKYYHAFCMLYENNKPLFQMLSQLEK